MSKDFVMERKIVVGWETCLFFTLIILFFISYYLLHFFFILDNY